ncbi:SDR family NAD(P)-dependent oxidoreductase [Nocardiopsis halotolerans]|uniref:SDR family NAD(P)-dependent oxidoreductase n=1 Tax=Nocardiopsis halotolerans TaxID=124252 RepID=UPI0003818336|nr:SDR family NAD(P)-dependent oxidoreductase [Nocardiopsis halotolerans]
MELERLCWPERLRLPEEILRRRLSENPGSHFVVEEEGCVWGVIYSQRINAAEELFTVDFATADSLHRPDAEVAHVLSLNIDPGRQGRGYGDTLLEHLLTLCREQGAVRSVVGVTRCKDIERHPGIDLEDYIRERTPQGRLLDTVLRMHQSHGAEVRGLVPGYRPGDRTNGGNGVLVEYDLERREERVREYARGGADGASEIPGTERLTAEVVEAVAGLSDTEETEEGFLDTPLFELGLDSADLLELQGAIEERYGLGLDPLFLFDHDTPARIISALDRDGDQDPDAAAGRSPVAEHGGGGPRDIAIVGMACRLPGGIEHYTDLWRLLEAGGSAVGNLPESRWRWPEGIDPAQYPGIDRGGFVTDADRFEAELFRITPNEARLMDPQQRWMLELTWACLEDAGYRASSLRGTSTGVYIGASGSDYQRFMDSAGVPVRAHSGLATSMAIIANRVSYFYDLRGPSVQTDTACSSSLVAVHAAVRALREGECETAVVGGVNALCHPANTLAYHQAGMLSPDGLCKTFDASADGYVRSEGGVVLLLKPLAKALEDRDHVHAVIRGSATNHGGQSGGLTVPNADMQSELVASALADARAEPSDVGYVEAHGTGTALGDPIEVQGLSRVFTGSRSPCALGSVKTNLGHLEAAAGVTGLLKAVLCTRNGALPANVHYTRLNPRITLDDSPLYVVDGWSRWERGRRSALLAGVSSFGSGGSNAHVIVEEHADTREAAGGDGHAVLPVLSAGTGAQLVRQAEHLLAYLRRAEPDGDDLLDLAYTLQVGREEMRERVAFLPVDGSPLEDLLAAFVRGEEGTPGVFRGTAAPRRGRTAGGTASATETTGAWLASQDHAGLLEAWTRGAEVDWELLYADGTPPRRVPLPTHAFAETHYWIEEPVTGPRPRHTSPRPPLGERAPEPGTTGHRAVLTGAEPFLADHRVRNAPVLPAAVHLEMARAAVARTLHRGDDAPVRLGGVVWTRPLTVDDGPREVYVSVVDGADGTVSYELRSDGGNGRDVVHSRGTGAPGPAFPPPALDVDSLRSRMSAGTLSHEECYAALGDAGFDYGGSHRSLRTVWLGDGELLAAIALPDGADTHPGGGVLHPSIVDGALQAVIVPRAHETRHGRSGGAPALPFSAEGVEVYGSSPSLAYAWIREARPGAHRAERWDLDLCDEHGEVFVSLRGYTMRGGESGGATGRGTDTRISLLRPEWAPRPVPERSTEPAYQARSVLACGFGGQLAELRALAPHIEFTEVTEPGASVADTLRNHALNLLGTVREALLAGPSAPALVQVLVGSGEDAWALRALAGLTRSAHQENPDIVGQVITVPGDATASYLVERLEEEAHAPKDHQISHEGGERRVLDWRPLPVSQDAAEVPWRSKGVYVITGGAGGLGVLFAEEIVRYAQEAVLVLTGRSPLDAARRDRLDALEARGARVEYHRLDVSDADGTEALVADVKRRFGALHGVVHAAGVIHDDFVVRKSAAEFESVLSPKVDGCLNLDRATRDEELDFFVLFSSVMGVTGNVGQADYAVANAFMDGFARERDALVRAGRRTGRTLSVGWPLWRDGGMGADDATRDALRSRAGLVPLETPDGFRAFYRAMGSGEVHVLVMAGEGDRAVPFPPGTDGSGDGPARTAPAHRDAPAAGDDRTLLREAVRLLREEIAARTGHRAAEIDADEPLGTYGMDSILATEVTSGLEATFGSLPKTLLFEYHTLTGLGGYLVDRHRSRLFALLPQEGPRSEDTRRAPDAPTKAGRAAAEPAGDGTRPSAPAHRGSSALDIAVIGLSGRYPEARDLGEYWRNLRDGRDCVVEVPAGRWDWRDHYTEDRTVPDRHHSKWGGFIPEVDRFDPLFFNISPREADYLDPQERLFLEHAWAAMEDAGYTREALGRVGGEPLGGRVGVYAGVMWGQYQLLFRNGNGVQGNPNAIGASYASVANRVSFVMNLHGPSMTVDTMCSSSLTAVELACRDLSQGRAGMAFAGGVNVTVHPNKYLSLSNSRFISSQGHCESFGEGGDGYVPGEGVGVVLLKPLADAERDGDHVYGVIKGSAVTHGGRTNGYTVPNPRAQGAAVRAALDEAGVPPRAVSYVEAHGTGTKLGDPIEIGGLSQAFGDHEDTGYCRIGSAKSNIGHCESAAGIAGLSKVLLQLKHGQIAPSLHSRTLNPDIDFANTPFEVNQELCEWERPVFGGRSWPRVAGVSSFGAGGSNAHLVVEEHVDRRPKAEPGRPVLVPLSARDGERLRAYADDLLRFVREERGRADGTPLEDLAFTLQVGREAMDVRLGVLADSLDSLADGLERYLAGDTSAEGVLSGDVRDGREALALIPEEDLDRIVGGLLERGELTDVLRFWVKGAVPDWYRLHGDRTPRRTSAPTYPFARERHWVPRDEAAVTSGDTERTGTARRTTRFLGRSWRETPVRRGPAVPADAVVLHDPATGPLADAVVALLDGATAVGVAPDTWERFGSRIENCSTLIDLTGMSEHGPASEPVLLLQRALASRPSRELRLLFVTRGLEDLENTRVDLAGASRVGLYRTLGSEYSALTSRHLDLDPGAGRPDEVAAAVREEVADTGAETAVCLRGGRRYVAVLEETAPGAPVGAPAFAEDEVLLVTGGTRGLGLLCARHLVERCGVRRLVLTGREALPPRRLWDTADGHPSSVRDKIRAVLDLEAAGVEVRVLATALDRADEVDAMVRSVQEEMGVIAGVVHAAGLVDTEDPAFVRKTPEGIARVVSPKVEGSRNLLRSLDHRALRFVLLFSSVSSAVPALGAGQSDYAMGNAFMDHLARAHAGSPPVTSVQWPSWRETGFGEVTARAYTDTGLLSITDEEGLALLDEVLRSDRGPVVMPVVVDPDRFDAEALAFPREGTSGTGSPGSRGGAVTGRRESDRRESTEAPVPPGDDTARALAAYLTEVFEEELRLRPGQLDEETSYAEYGADSILLAQVLQKLRGRLGTDLEPSALLEYSSVRELSEWLLDAHGEEVAAALGGRNAPEEQRGEDGRNPGPSRVDDARPVANVRRSAAAPHGRGVSVAVIGMACRMPGAPDLDSYWDLLSRGRSGIRRVPESRWAEPVGLHAGLIDDAHLFDAARFALSPEDARAMDPQALVLLEESLKAVHHAGYRPDELDGSGTGVYVGARSRPNTDPGVVGRARNPIMAVGQNYLAANVSQTFNWEGPAMVVDTACSSALTAMRVAADALASGSVDQALVAGVSLLADPSSHELFRRRGLLQEDGVFHVFDRRASGVVLGEGVGVVLLKPLARAEAEGDTIHAVIEGVAVNNDGRTAGPATPNPRAQERVMRQALEQAGCTPDQVRYLHVNGSGSEMTDLLELKAVKAVYGGSRPAPLHLGSVKPNIGHPLCAEGIAGFISAVLTLRHQSLVPFLSGQEPPEHFDMDAAGFVLPRELAGTRIPYAAVSSFADGGTNGHVVLRHHERESTRVPRRPLEPPVLDRSDVRFGEASATRDPRPAPDASAGVLAHDPSGTWTARLDAAHPILANHRVHGRRLMPGVAWIDLLYQWFAEAGADFAGFALRDLTIHRPLAVAEGEDARLRITAHPDGADGWRVEVREAGSDDGTAEPPYVTAEMRERSTGADDVRVRPDTIHAEGSRVKDLRDVYGGFRDRELVHDGPMRAVGASYTGPRDVWVHVAVDDRAPVGAGEHLFHPALIDASAVAAIEAVESAAGGAGHLFLPLFHGSFHASAPLRTTCYTRVRRDTVVLGADLLSFTMEFFDAGGRRIGELTDFTCKAVRDPELLGPHTGTGGRTVSREPVGPDGGTVPRRTSVDPGAHETLLASLIASHLGVPEGSVSTTAGYYELGLVSVQLLQLTRELESALGTRLPPTLFFEYPTVSSLAEHLADLAPGAPDSPAPAPSAAHDPRSVVTEAAAVQGRPAPHAGVTEPERRDIAIIGIAGRYPKAADLAEFWENLKAGRNCVTEVPEERWSRDHLAGVRSPSGREMSRWGGFLDDVARFDARFFGIPDEEAALLDPQERLFLETCWEVMEDAGYTPDNLVEAEGVSRRRPVGVYAGVMHKDYALVQRDAAGHTIPLALNHAPIANRVSHLCDFHGPSMVIDTVCASSLSAVHLAAEDIRRGECRVAIVGGVNLSLHPSKYQTYGLQDLHASGEPGRPFGAGGDGFVSSEGVGAVLLKPLDRALADGDGVYAVIRGSAVSHSGRTSGFRVPSVAAQEALVTECLDRAGVDPRTVSYVETHATGTELGDLIEFQALSRVFGGHTEERGFCALGSVKAGIGHAESAAGISALTKTVLQLHHATLTPQPETGRPNPYVDFEDSPFRLQTRLDEWTVDGPRRAGVSAFGATGANAHVILEEAPTGEDPVSDTVPHGVLVPISARNDDRLRAYARRLLRFLEARERVDLRSLAFTLQTGRVALEERAVLLAHGVDDARDALDALAEGRSVPNLWRGRVGDPRTRPALLDEDDLRRDLVRRWSGQGAWNKVAELWLQGYELDWTALHDSAPRRLHLPTYPFAGDRHWVRSDAGAGAPDTAGEARSERSEPHQSGPTPASPGGLLWDVLPEGEPAPPDAVALSADLDERARGFLRDLVAVRLGRSATEIAPHTPLLDLGLTSVAAVGLARELVRTVDPGFLPSALFEHDTVADLSAYLVARRPGELARLVARRRGERRDGDPEPPPPGGGSTPDDPVLDALERLRDDGTDLDEVIALLAERG